MHSPGGFHSSLFHPYSVSESRLPKTTMQGHAEDPKSWVETVDNLATMEGKRDGDAAGFAEGTDEEKKLVRKIDLFLMPTIWILYCFSYMVLPSTC